MAKKPKKTNPNYRGEKKWTLARLHYLRMEEHWGKRWAQENAFAGNRWPITDADWRQTDHGAPWDTNVEMAFMYLRIFRKLYE